MTATWYGACGVEFCGDCLPRYDENNDVIPPATADAEATS